MSITSPDHAAFTAAVQLNQTARKRLLASLERALRLFEGKGHPATADEAALL